MNAVVRGKPWKNQSPPKKILAMRFQALGDTIITLPYLQSLKRQYPNVELHFLTREEVCAIPKSIKLFDKVIAIGGKRNAKIQFILSLIKLPWFWLQGYDAVLDLQNHRFSKIIRKLIFADAWVEFDRSSPISAGERTRQTIEALWTWKIKLDPKFSIVNSNTIKLLFENGYRDSHDLVVLNPAGFCESRSWPLENYVAFANEWLLKINSSTQFVLLLLPNQKHKSEFIKQRLGDRCIDLSGKANQKQAFEIINNCKFVLSEDSGLMHMAWVQGIPTIALFGSSRKDWSAPQGEHSYCFDSSDLECGPCMLEKCKFDDNRCLTRYTVSVIVDQAKKLLR
jgi:heptosyltransferase II